MTTVRQLIDLLTRPYMKEHLDDRIVLVDNKDVLLRECEIIRTMDLNYAEGKVALLFRNNND